MSDPKKPMSKHAQTRKRHGGKTTRVCVFEALDRRPLLYRHLQDELGGDYSNGQLGVILRGEIAAGRVRSQEDFDANGRTVVVYSLTARGRRHLEADTVDSWAKEKRLVYVGRLEETFEP